MEEDNDNLNVNLMDLTFEQSDALKELANIGCGNAVTALSKMLNRKIQMSLTSLVLNPIWKIMELIEGKEFEVFGIFSSVNDNPNLALLQIYTKESILNIINALFEEEDKRIEDISDLRDLDDFTISIISEIGNILAGHYISSIAEIMHTKLMPDVPAMAFDNINAIMDPIIAKYSELVNFIVLINTNIKIEELSLDGKMFFIPDVDTLKSLYESLEIDYK